MGGTLHAAWGAPPPENCVFGVKHSINCFAVFVGRATEFVVGFQRFATPGRLMRRPYICYLGQWLHTIFKLEINKLRELTQKKKENPRNPEQR